MRTVSLLVISVLLLASCSSNVFSRPRPWGLGDTPEGSPTFQKGWNDGCDTGLGVSGGLAYRREAYRFKQDISMIENPEYYRAWKDAYTYCRWYVGNWSRPWHGSAISTVFD